MAAAVAGFGIFSGVTGILNTLITRLSGLHDRYKIFHENPKRWEKLKNDLSNVEDRYEKAKELFQENEESLSLSISTIIKSAMQDGEKALSEADNISKELYKALSDCSSSSASASPSTQNPGTRVKQVFKFKSVGSSFPKITRTEKIKKLLDSLETAHLQLDNKLMHIVSILSSSERHDFPNDEFVPWFDSPYQHGNVQLDFDSKHNNEECLTAEGRLKQKVLYSIDNNEQRISAAIGRPRAQTCELATGMGGVGKTVALRGLCVDEDVTKEFNHGVFFMELGQNANDEKVITEISKMVRNSGGKMISAEIRKQTRLHRAVEEARDWFEGRKVLLVCDDVWSTKNKSKGYTQDLHSILGKAPGSRMVISSRDEKTQWRTEDIVEFWPHDAEGSSSLTILFSHAAVRIEKEIVQDRNNLSDALRFILGKCAGLPLALAVAGANLRDKIKALKGNINRALEILENELKQDASPLFVCPVDDHPGLQEVLEMSIRACQSWGRDIEAMRACERELNMGTIIESLCVLDQRASVPQKTLQLLWDLETLSQTTLVFEKLCSMNLMSRSQSADGQTICGQVHDLVLDVYRRMAKERRGTEFWHSELLKKYHLQCIRSRHDFYDHINDGTARVRPWWTTELNEDGYIHENLARHLRMGGMHRELKCLVSDLRWTMRRREIGDWLALKNDFMLAIETCEKPGEADGLQALLNALEKGWIDIRESKNCIGMRIHGSLGQMHSEDEYITRYLESVQAWCPLPWLRPCSQIYGPVDDREIAAIRLGSSSVLGIRFMDEDRIRIDTWETRPCNRVSRYEHNIVSKTTADLWHKKIGVQFTQGVVDSDGNFVLLTEHDLKVVVQNDGIQECILKHTKKVTHIGLEGRYVVTVSENKALRVWNCISGDLLFEIADIGFKIEWVEMSSDGQWFVCGSENKLTVWNSETGEEVWEHVVSQGIFTVGFSDDFQVIVCVTGSEVSVFKQNDDTLRYRKLWAREMEKGRYVESAAISKDQSRIALWYENGRVFVLDVASKNDVCEPLGAGLTRCGRFLLALSEDGKRLATADGNDFVRVWDVKPRDCSFQIEPLARTRVEDVSLSDSGVFASFKTYSGSVCLANAATGKIVQSFQEPSVLDESGVNMIGDKIIVANEETGFRFWDASTFEATLPPLRTHSSPSVHFPLGHPGCYAFSADAQMVIFADRCAIPDRDPSGNGGGWSFFAHSLVVWTFNLADNGWKQVWRVPRQPRFVALSANGHLAAGIDDDQYAVFVLNAGTGDLVHGCLQGHTSYGRHLKFSADGQMLVSASNNEVLIWNVSTGELLRELRCNTANPSSSAYSDDGIYCLVRAVMLRLNDESETKRQTLDSSQPCRSLSDDEVERLVRDHDIYTDGGKIYLGSTCIGIVPYNRVSIRYDSHTRAFVCRVNHGELEFFEMISKRNENAATGLSHSLGTLTL